jgi:hypothetical protein
VDRDQLLADVTLYWLTGTAGSSAALCTRPPTSLPVRHLAERNDRIVHWSELARRGHFPAMEAPGLLAGDIRACFRQLR